MAVNCYLTFSTTYFALQAENVLKKGSQSFKMVPVPRSISSSCGTALRCSCSDAELIKDILTRSAVEIEGMHEVEEKEFKLPRLFSRGEKDDG